MDPSSLTKTSFCGKTVDNVTKNEVKQFILDDMKLKCGGLGYKSRYAKLYNEQYSRNLNNPHVICLKSSGAPYLLYCTQINGVNYSFLIDKKVKPGYDFPKIFVTPYQFSSENHTGNEIYLGTLFEVELLRDKNTNWTLLLGDIYYNQSMDMRQVVITERISKIHEILSKRYTPNQFCDICPLQVKRYFDFCEKDYLMNTFIPNLSYKTRGFYFIPLKCSYSKILYLFQEGDLKQTKQKRTTLNFQIQPTLKRDVYELYLQGPTNIVKQGIACIPTLKCSRMVRSLFETNKDTVIVECRYNDKFKKWEPLQVATTVSRSDEI